MRHSTVTAKPLLSPCNACCGKNLQPAAWLHAQHAAASACIWLARGSKALTSVFLLPLCAVRGVNYAQANDGVTYTVLLLNGGSSVTEASNLTLQVTSSDAAYPSTINTSCTPSLPLANGDTIAAAGVLRCAFTVIVQPSHVLARQMPSFRVKAVTGTTNRTTYAVQVVAPAVPLYTNPMLSVYPEVSGIESITYQIGKIPHTLFAPAAGAVRTHAACNLRRRLLGILAYFAAHLVQKHPVR